MTTLAPVTSVFRQTTRVQVANTNVETTLLGAGSGAPSMQGPALRVGALIRVRLRGIYTTQATPGTLTLRVKLAGATVATCTGTPTASQTNRSCDLEFEAVVRSVGVSGTAFPWAAFVFNSSATATARWAANTNATVSLNTTGAIAIDVTAQWQTASATNDLRVDQAEIDLIQ